MLFAYPLGEFTGKQPLCFCILQFILHVFSLFCPTLFFSLHQAWLIVDFHQITTIIRRPAPPSRQPVKASPADRKEKSRFTHFRKSRLSPWQGHGCQIPASLQAVSHPLILLKESIWSVAWSLSLEEDVVLEKTKQSMDLFFFFSYVVTQFPSSPFSSFFLLKISFSLNCSLYISALCSFCEI